MQQATQRENTLDRDSMNEKASRRFYNKFSGVYDIIFSEVFRHGREQALRELMLEDGTDVLEVGIGTGLTVPMYPTGTNLTGVDLSASMLTEAKERLAKLEEKRTVGFARMDATHLAFPDNSFDRVYAPYVVSVVPQPRDVVAEMGRVCRPGGRVVIVNHFGSESRVGSWLERRLTPLTHHVGFRLDLPVESILGIPGMVKVVDRRVNMLKLWRLLVFEKRA